MTGPAGPAGRRSRFAPRTPDVVRAELDQARAELATVNAATQAYGEGTTRHSRWSATCKREVLLRRVERLQRELADYRPPGSA